MLKTLSHNSIAIILGIFSSLFGLVLFYLYLHIDSDYDNYFIILLALMMFAGMYMISRYTIKYFIIQKVTPIYKTIHETQIKAKGKSYSDGIDNINILEQTDEEVREWTTVKSKEIEELKKLEKYRKEYIGDVSHELKTPIFNIQGYISTLLDGGIEDTTINRKYLERADKAINRMISIVRDLEAISRLESGELQLNKEVFNLKGLVLEIFEAQELLSTDREVRLHLHENRETNIYVSADRKLIGQVFTNLIVNSIKYGKKGGNTTVSFYDMDSFVLVEIKDDGIGIAETHLPRIFERFYRIDKSRSRDLGGTGLGLSIVKHIIEAHKQTINVKSKPNQGTSFTFTLDRIM